MNSGTDCQNIGEDIAGDATVRVADVPPGRIRVAHVSYNVPAEQHIFCAVKLGSCRLPAPFGVRPAAPLDQIVFYKSIGRSHSPNTLDAAIAKGIPPDNLRRSGMRRASAIAVAANV